jgi:hypothetical protein
VAFKVDDTANLHQMIGKASFPKEHLQGEGGEAINELRQYAYSMGVNLADSWYTARARTVLQGKGTLQDYKSEIMNKAKAAFPQWGKQIEAGQSVADIAQPYIQSMAQVLELPSGSVNQAGPRARALHGTSVIRGGGQPGRTTFREACDTGVTTRRPKSKLSDRAGWASSQVRNSAYSAQLQTVASTTICAWCRTPLRLT